MSVSDSDQQDYVDPDETQEVKPPPVPPRPRHSLRRRVLVWLLLATTIPGYAALLLSWYLASQTVETSARRQAIDMATALAMDLDVKLRDRMLALEELAGNERFADSVRPWALASASGEDLSFPGNLNLSQRGMENARLFLIGSSGQIIAEVTSRGATRDFERISVLDSWPALEVLDSAYPAQPFMNDLSHQTDYTNPWLLMAAPLTKTEDSSQSMLLAAMTPLAPLFRDTERLNPDLGQRLVVLGERGGVIYATQEDEDYTLAINRMRNVLLQDGTEQLVPVEVREGSLGLAHRTLRVPMQYSGRERLPDIRWSVVQAVDMDEVLESLERDLWIAIIVALILTVVAVFLAVYLSRKLVGPILRLTEGMQRYAVGDLDYRVDVRTGDEIEVLAQAANEMAESLRLSYENLGQRMQQLDEKASQLELIYSISHSVNRVLDLEKLFTRIIREILIHVPCDRVSLGLIDETRENLVLEHVYPRDRKTLPRNSKIPMAGSVMGRALKDQVLTVRKLRAGGKYYEDHAVSELGMNVLCVVPLVATNGPVGTLNLASVSEDSFGKGEIRLLERVADSLALAVEHGRLYTRVARFAEELEETVQQRTRELRQAQAKLVQTEKFAATGSIAAHIGHEINNPLSIIKNYLQLVKSRMRREKLDEKDLESTRESIQIIGEEIDRIARIVAQLRQVSKPSRPENQLINLSTEIRKIVELFEGSARRRGIEIELQLSPEITEVSVCSDYLRQILINLLRNAVDAMEDTSGGIITISTALSRTDAGFYTIEVRDTGPGIPPENINSIFDPFFTTKSEGKGTGLGLSVSFGLAQTMGGRLEAESIYGESAAMRLVLPTNPAGRTSGEADRQKEEAPERASDSGIRRQGEKIIIG